MENDDWVEGIVKEAKEEIEAENPSQDAKAIAISILRGFELIGYLFRDSDTQQSIPEILSSLASELDAIRQAIDLHE